MPDARQASRYRIVNPGTQPIVLEAKTGGARVSVSLGSRDDRGIVGRDQPDVEVDGDTWRAIRGAADARPEALKGGQRIVRGMLDARTLYEYAL